MGEGREVCKGGGEGREVCKGEGREVMGDGRGRGGR